MGHLNESNLPRWTWGLKRGEGIYPKGLSAGDYGNHNYWKWVHLWVCHDWIHATTLSCFTSLISRVAVKFLTIHTPYYIPHFWEILMVNLEQAHTQDRHRGKAEQGKHITTYSSIYKKKFLNKIITLKFKCSTDHIVSAFLPPPAKRTQDMLTLWAPLQVGLYQRGCKLIPLWSGQEVCEAWDREKHNHITLLHSTGLNLIHTQH